MKKIADSPIAIIGMGAFFAQATGLSEYWRLIYRGIDAITEPPETHSHLNDYYDPDPKRPDHIYCKRGGFLTPVPFDPTEFGIPPASLEATDTSQLLGLLAAKMALKDAGYGDNGRSFEKENTSVILGVTGTQELVVALGSRLGHPRWRRALSAAQVPSDQSGQVIQNISDAYVGWQENSFPGLLGNVVAGRICNRLDLGGTNCIVDAACASSLSAVHLALMELSTGRSNMVITGGVDTLNDIFMHMCFSQTGVLSKSGNARPFSKDADGTVLGEGVGLLVLKRLEDAVNDQDRIYAVIKALGSSSDGKSQSIYAPRSEGQIRALTTAYQRAGIDPATIDLIEAHGTGTQVGDQVEFQSLSKVFGSPKRNGNRHCLGSVKSMIGHTKAAAGAAGLIKAALALYHKVLPPTLKADPPDPQLQLEDSSFFLSPIPRPWPAPKAHPRRAAVSAFGFGGSNFHAVLEEYHPQRDEPAWDDSVDIFAFSGPDLASIATQIKSIRNDPDLIRLPGLGAYRAAQSRKAFQTNHPHRLLLVGNMRDDMPHLLKEAQQNCLNGRSDFKHPNSKGLFYGTGKSHGKLAMIFPGQGSQYTDMARDLICTFPEALSILDKADTIWTGEGRLSDRMFPVPNSDPTEKEIRERRLRHTHAAQMALGTVEAGMLGILRRFDISAEAYCGHSYGELAALYAAGWIDLETLFVLSDSRGRSMAQAGNGASKESGTMLAVAAPLDQIELLAEKLAPEVVLANRNSLTQGVLSGSRAGIDKAMTSCKEKGWRAVELPVAAAFHSPLIRTALAPFSESVQSAPLRPTEIPVYSNRTAQPYPVEPDQAKELLVGQMVSAVDFVGMIQHLYDSGVTTFLEVGPKKVLSGLIKGILPSRDIQLLSLDGSAGNKNGLEDLARTLCSLAASGRFVNLDAWGSECEEPRRPRMQVMLSGANYRSAKQTNRSAQAMTPSASAEKRSAVNAPKALKKTAGLSASPKPAIPTAADHPSHPVPQTTAENHHPTTPIRPEAIRPMTTKAPISAPHANVQDALAVVQQGIQSMQALHLQTAQTHQKFLEAQAEAGRTLQAMIHQTQTLTGRTTPGIPVMEHRTGISPETPHAPTGSSIPPYRDQTSLPESLPAPSVAPTIPAVTPAMPSSPQAPQTRAAAPAASVPTNSSAGNDIQSTLLTVVGDLTGYPEEMLELDMDIESDLGIDSIKRVEILSTLEERLPGLPSITPDMLGTLTTLGQIIEFLTGRGETASAVPPSPPATAPSDNSGAKIEKTLLAVVGELTGYPGEMLELDMDIESDLGIDSIKRVEILSTLEERMPGLPSVTPDMLGTLKTLGQIVEFLADSGGVPPAKTSAVPKAEPEKSSKQVQETLLAVVSELTGYPDEMLELDMDIESDLGIDSIKRVEILSTLEERLPGLPAVTPDMLGTLKTLGQIVAYLAGPQGASEETPRSRTGNSDQCRPEKIRTAVLAVVGELTGYPEEMLELDMDIESDLGIDSIKRVEILSTLEERMPDLPAVTPDMLGSLKTLGQIVDYLAGSAPAAARQTDAPLSPPDNAESPQTALPAKSSSTPKEAMRRLVTLRDLAVPTPNTDARIPTAGRIYITQDKAGLSRSLAEALKSRGCQVSIIEPDAHPIPNGFADAAGLILMPPIEACDAFKLAQAAGPQLIRKARSHQSLFASISRLDGAFGFYGRKMDDPLQGALAGLTKTAAREWQGVICRSLDISPDWQDLEQISKAAADLLLSDPESVPPEVGLSESHVVAPELTPAPRETGSISLSPQDVLIVTGGGRGVTAEAALALAQAAPCRMVLLGRSPNPCQEPDWLAGIKGPKEIKKAILTHEFKGQKAHPKEVEARFRFWQANREIHATLTRISATGAQITYFQQDVLETATLPSLFEKIRRDFGPIKGLIHGAGVLHDRLILEKEPAQFERVYRTKVDALTALLAALESDDLKYLVLFSSVSARIGNKGQADYAMANEVLNKMAWQQRQRRPQCKVVSINWGPWDGGMVDPGLKREFQRQGVSLIPLHDGAQAMVTEMSTAVDEPAEVVIGATFETGETSVAPLSPPLGSPLKLAAKVAATNEAPLAVLFKREIDIESYPILSDHVLAGRPVVPLALMTEWLGHSALHENPGLMFHGIDNLRLMSGIKLANTKRIIQLMAGKPRRKDSLFEVDVEIRNGSTDDRAAIHSRATALLTDKLPAPPRYGRLEFEGESPAANKSPADFYQETLFHGEQLQGIRSILNISSQGMAAQLSTAPDPQSWMSAPLRSQWILDPLVLDCAFQMAIIWCHEQLGKRCLPSFAARYRQYRETFPHEGVNAHLTVHKANAAKMIGDFTFLDHKGGLVAQMTGYEAVIDATLDKAFNQKNAA